MEIMTIKSMQDNTLSTSEHQIGALQPHSDVTETQMEKHEHSETTNDIPKDTPIPNDKSAAAPHMIDSPKTRKTRDQKILIERLLHDCKTKGLVSLDLSQKCLRKVPEELLQLTHLEYLYLEGNEISCLPENFFDCLPNLQWLDLRNNCLQTIPSAYIGRHQNLRNLLVQGNQLRTLPLELGLVSTLNGLNISDNPLEFPPQEVRDRGTQIILLFLREVLNAKSLGKFPADGKCYSLRDFEVFVDHQAQTLPQIEDLRLDSEDASSEDEWGPTSYRSRRTLPSSQGSAKASTSAPHAARADGETAELGGPVMHSASLQERANYQQKRRQKLDKLRRAGALGALDGDGGGQRPMGKKKLSRLSSYPEPPPVERVEQTYVRERKQERLRDLQQQQELILQRRRDQEALKDWRGDAKVKQMKKHREKMIKGKIDYDEAARTAPFGVSDSHMVMETNEERIARDIREKHENMRRVLSPGEVAAREEARVARDRELEKRLRDHTHEMNERRRRPRGTPQEEMRAAKEELQVAEQLQREIEQRRKALEYRFTAFTGDTM